MARRMLVPAPGAMLHPLTYVRAANNWTLQDLVDLLARRVGNSAGRREKAWRWENWGVVPDDESQLALAKELGIPEATVRSLRWPHWLPTGETVDITLPWTWDTTLGALDQEAGSAMLDRRGFLTLGTGMFALLARQWVNEDAPRLVAALRGGRIDVATVECFEQRVPWLRSLDMSLGGGGSVRGVVDAELRLVTDLLSSGSYSEDVGRRMISVAAELGRVAGWASFDSGYHAAAERYWIAALRAAHSSADRAQGANILKCMSLQQVDLNRRDEALALAQSAYEGARNAPPRIVAMLTVRLARTYASVSDAASAERLLVSAELAIARADDQEVPGWASYFDSAEYCAQVAACYRQLGRHGSAEHWLSQAVALQPATRSRDRATYLIWRADNFIGLGDLEQACGLVESAIPDLEGTRSARNTVRLTKLVAKINKVDKKNPAVTGLNNQLRVLESIQ